VKNRSCLIKINQLFAKILLLKNMAFNEKYN